MRRSLTIVLLLLAASPAGAEPVPITSGFVNFTDEPGDFSLVGPGFDLSGAWFPTTLSGTFWFDRCGHPQLPGPGGCVPGAVIDFGRTTYGLSPDVSEGSGVIGSVVHDRLFYSGEWTFDGPSVMSPVTLDEPRLVREGAFTFEGNIAAFLDASRTGTPLFSTSLRGSGVAQAFFGVETSNSAGDRLIVHDLDYTFEAQEPVPEPSSMLLIGTGLALGVSRFRRRLRKPESRPPQRVHAVVALRRE
jgi:PEP-CTERM motif-containing protein